MIFIITTGAGDAYGVLWVEPRNVIIYPAIYRTAIQLAQPMDSVELEKLERGTENANRWWQNAVYWSKSGC